LYSRFFPNIGDVGVADRSEALSAEQLHATQNDVVRSGAHLIAKIARRPGRIFGLSMILTCVGRWGLIPLATILTVSVISMSALSAAAQTATFELNGTRFYVPKAWTINAVGSEPPYHPSAAIADDVVFKVDRTILILFPKAPGQSDWQERYPEINPPFIYELVISPGIRDLNEARQRSRGTSDPEVSKRLNELQPDPDGFVRLGDKYYVAVRPGDDDGAGGYLQFLCRASLTEKDRGIFSRCTVYTYVLDGVGLRASFDSLEFDKSRWREVPRQVDALVKWLTTPPSQRRKKIN
jgi:hypothetical protein